MLEVVLAVPFWLEFAAVLAGGLAGAMSAARARFDIFGVVSIAIITGLAGGIIRDLLLQNYGIYAFQKPELILACVAAGIVVFFFSKVISYLNPVIDLLDNLSLSLWTIIGAGKALSAGLGIIPAIILGTVTAVGGGITRDISMSRAPEAFQAGAMNGSAAFIGALVYVLLAYEHILDDYSGIICVALVLVIRYASLFFGWRTRPVFDYSDTIMNAVAKPVRRVARRVRPPKGKVERDKERRSYYRFRAFWDRLNNETGQRAPGSENEQNQNTEGFAAEEQVSEAHVRPNVDAQPNEHMSPRRAAWEASKEDEDYTPKTNEDIAQAEAEVVEAVRERREANTARPDEPVNPSGRIFVDREELYKIMNVTNDEDEPDKD